MKIICPCIAATANVEWVREADGRRIPLGEFSELRERCLALQKILIPDEIWPNFIDWHTSNTPDSYSHASIVLVAFRRGYLPCITDPIHRHLMNDQGLLSAASKQYVMDLREREMDVQC